MSATPPPNSLYPALLAAMQACGPVRKNATNPHLKSKYADLTSVLDTIEQPLWDNGLLIVQQFWAGDNVLMLRTQIVHAATGDSITSDVPVVCKDPTDPQKIGAAITYYRRYSLLALLGLAPEDDDGHAAAQPPTNHPANQSAPPRGNYSVVAYEPANQTARTSRADPSPLPPSSRPAVAPTGGGPPSPAPVIPYTAGEYEAVVREAWKMEMAGDDYPVIVAYMKTHRNRLTDDQLEDSREEMRLVKAAMFPDTAAVS